MKNMKLFILILTILSSITSAQNITFIYELNKPNNQTEYYYLDVLGKQSVFRSESARKADSLALINGYYASKKPTFEHLYSFKNLISKKIYKSVTHPALYDLYYINIDENLDWNVHQEKQKIGEFECQKATTKYGGRTWIAWFDVNNPLQEGPYIFHGLPGFIVKLTDVDKNFDFNLIRIKRSSKNNQFNIRKGKEINWEVYKKLQEDYYSDPFSAIKAQGYKMKIGDDKGNTLDMSFKDLTANLQKQLKEKNSPVELNQKVEFK